MPIKISGSVTADQIRAVASSVAMLSTASLRASCLWLEGGVLRVGGAGTPWSRSRDTPARRLSSPSRRRTKTARRKYRWDLFSGLFPCPEIEFAPKTRKSGMSDPNAGTDPDPFDVLVIGGGVVGLSVARACAVRGASVVVVEREDDWAAGASSGNSGISCTGYDAPVGSLERQLLRRSIQLHPQLMRSFGLTHVRTCGSLVVAWSPVAHAKLPEVLAQNREAGDVEAELLSAAELRAREPSISSEALGAVWCPREAVVEPWLVPHGYAESAALCGARMRLSTEAVGARYDAAARCWGVRTLPSASAQSGRSPPGRLLVPPPPAAPPVVAAAPAEELRARVVINCAGLYGDVVHQWGPGAAQASEVTGLAPAAMGDPSARVSEAAPFHLTPRKGQFVVLQPAPGAAVPDAVLEQVATQFTKGVILWKTLYGNVVVGPTAEPQASRSDRTTDEETLRSLVAHGERCVPALRGATVLGTYAGLRPATEHRDYQISCVGCGEPSEPSAPAAEFDPAANSLPSDSVARSTNLLPHRLPSPASGGAAAGGSGWISVAGIRSTGLTCAPGIGEYVAELYVGLRDGAPPVHASAPPSAAGGGGATPPPGDGCALGVTEAVLNPLPLEPPPARLNGAVPPLEHFAAEYRARGDGYVTLNGKLRRVTHPIASFGMRTMGEPAAQQGPVGEGL